MIDDLNQRLEKIIAELRLEVASLRTGRATPALVENLEVDAYGARQPLKALAAISTPEARLIVVQPWDRSLLPAIEKAIQVSPLGLQPVVDKDLIRLSFPVLTEERKRDLIKVLRERLEQTRIQVRRLRDEAMREIESRARAKEISEDGKFREKQQVGKAVGGCNEKIEALGSAKEREILAG